MNSSSLPSAMIFSRRARKLSLSSPAFDFNKGREKGENRVRRESRKAGRENSGLGAKADRMAKLTDGAKDDQNERKRA